MADRPQFTYYGHSTVRCDLASGEVLLIDPFVASNPSCPESMHSFDRIDAMLITHAHMDHMADAVELARRYQPAVVVGSFEVCHWLESQGIENLAPMNLGGRQTVLGCDVAMVRADHSSGLVADGQLLDGGPASGYMVHSPDGYRFYHAGDTALFSDMKLLAELYRPQLGFLPIGDLFTMDPVQAAMACGFLGLEQVVPIHWGTFPVLTGTPAALAKELAARTLDTEVIALEPGEVH